MGLLDADSVLVHALAIDRDGLALVRQRKASLIVCPSSNQHLFGTLPNIGLLSTIENIALGSDSPLTAAGDLLDEIRFAIHSCNIAPELAYRMVTEAPAAILRLQNSEASYVFGCCGSDCHPRHRRHRSGAAGDAHHGRHRVRDDRRPSAVGLGRDLQSTFFAIARAGALVD